MFWKMLCFALQSMGHAKHKFPVYATRNVQTQLKSTVCIGYTPRARLLNHWATKPEVCNQFVLLLHNIQKSG